MLHIEQLSELLKYPLPFSVFAYSSMETGACERTLC